MAPSSAEDRARASRRLRRAGPAARARDRWRRGPTARPAPRRRRPARRGPWPSAPRPAARRAPPARPVPGRGRHRPTRRARAGCARAAARRAPRRDRRAGPVRPARRSWGVLDSLTGGHLRFPGQGTMPPSAAITVKALLSRGKITVLCYRSASMMGAAPAALARSPGAAAKTVSTARPVPNRTRSGSIRTRASRWPIAATPPMAKPVRDRTSQRPVPQARSMAATKRSKR